jgi:hypothetical protein
MSLIVDPTNSSTYKVVDKGGFAITYVNKDGAAGNYITDTFTIGGATIKALEMGLASESTLPMGIMGIGYDTDEASNSEESKAKPFIYPSIIDTMFNQSLISTKAYSLYLDDLEASTGSIIFGGLDSDKYHGDLLQLPIVPDTLQNGMKVYAEFSVAMTGFGITSQSGITTNFTAEVEAAILDSGTTVTYLPDRLVSQLIQAINGVDDPEGTGNIFVDCNIRNNASMTFNYGFGGANGVFIKVPVSELVFDLTGVFSLGPYSPPELPFSNVCAFGILPGGTEGPFTLGDTFLRSAYVVYDIQNNLIALAQTNFNSTTSSVVDFKAGATSIPKVSGVASSAQVTQTATGMIGPQKSATETGSGTTSTGTATRTSTGSTTTGSSATQTQSKSAAVGSVPAFNIQRLLILGISVAFAGLGGGFLFA